MAGELPKHRARVGELEIVFSPYLNVCLSSRENTWMKRHEVIFCLELLTIQTVTVI